MTIPSQDTDRDADGPSHTGKRELPASRHAEASFSFDSWEEEDVSTADGTRVCRTTFVKAFAGQVEGRSTGWMTTATTDSGAAAYCGMERYEVSIDGVAGTFVLHHNAGASPAGGLTSSILLLDGSATGELAGLTGTFAIDRSADGEHTLRVDYELG